MIAIPFTILVVVLSLHLIQDHGDQLRTAEGGVLALWRWPILAISVGALGAINTWDLPAYLVVLAICLLARGCRVKGARGVLEGLITALLVALVSLLAYAPFYSHYQAQHVGLDLVAPGERSALSDYALVWGSQLFLIASLLLFWVARDWPWTLLGDAARRGVLVGFLQRVARHSRRGAALWGLALVVLLLAVGSGGALAAKGMEVLALLCALLLASGVSLLRGFRGEPLMARLLVLVGLGILLAIELVYMRDFLAGSEWRRMNTVFKFFTQVWVMWGLAIGGGLPLLWQRMVRRGGAGASLWVGLCVLVTLAALLYPLKAVPARVTERFPGASFPASTLDGTAYMTSASYTWPDEGHRIDLSYDREAIIWLWREVQGTPVIAEASLGYYREGGMRVASYTGLPTIIGAHENEQRPGAEVALRDSDVTTLYSTTDLSQFESILAKYRVTYIYVGQLERQVYAGSGMAKFVDAEQAGLLTRVYHNERVDIYRVMRHWET